jgi:soluble lytic murein transglycosylase-like protein
MGGPVQTGPFLLSGRCLLVALWLLCLVSRPSQEAAFASDLRSFLLSEYIDKNAPSGVSSFERWEMARRIVIESDREGIPVYLAVAVAQQESGFDPRALNRASRDYGLYQIHFAFWKRYFARKGPEGLTPLRPDDLMSIPVNVRVGLMILGHDYELERGNLARTIGLYSGRKGPERDAYVDRVLKNEVKFLSFLSRHRPDKTEQSGLIRER